MRQRSRENRKKAKELKTQLESTLDQMEHQNSSLRKDHFLKQLEIEYLEWVTQQHESGHMHPGMHLDGVQNHALLHRPHAYPSVYNTRSIPSTHPIQEPSQPYKSTQTAPSQFHPRDADSDLTMPPNLPTTTLISNNTPQHSHPVQTQSSDITSNQIKKKPSPNPSPDQKATLSNPAHCKPSVPLKKRIFPHDEVANDLSTDVSQESSIHDLNHQTDAHPVPDHSLYKNNDSFDQSHDFGFENIDRSSMSNLLSHYPTPDRHEATEDSVSFDAWLSKHRSKDVASHLQYSRFNDNEGASLSRGLDNDTSSTQSKPRPRNFLEALQDESTYTRP